MNNRKGFNRLGRKPSHRNALHRNMVTSLFKYGRIKTTKAKAKEVRKTAEKMVTRAKIDSVHNRRIIAKDIKDKAVLGKLFTEISPHYSARNGGYTRILKIGYRNNDAAEMVLLELVDREEEPKKKKKKTAEKSEKAKTVEKSEKKAEKEEAVEVQAEEEKE
jgi:large subunit ribosomal protein L17